MKEHRAAVKAALERMEAAHTALDEAGEDADVEALTRTFDEAEADHKAAVTKFERAKLVEEARAAAPVEPVADDDDPEDDKPADPARAKSRTREGELVYQHRGEHSIFEDMARSKVENDSAAGERLNRHRQEMEERAHPSQTAGEGGELIAPVYLQDRWIKVPRAGRAIADSLNHFPFPGTNQINLPKILTGTTTAQQTDGGAVSSTDITTGLITGQAKTIAGQQDVSMQLVDLSEPAVGEVLFDDLARDYNQRVDVFVINNNGTNAKGLLEVSGTNMITYTQATPTVPLLYPKIANGVLQVNTGIFRPPNLIAMHPRRWATFIAALDSSNRPLITPYAPQNSIAAFDRVAPESLVGGLQGLPVIVDANLPTNEGASTNQDSILIYSADDLYLFEDETPRLRVLEEVLSGTLQVRFQLYNYVTLIAGRLPKAISKVQGTGLVEPSF